MTHNNIRIPSVPALPTTAWMREPVLVPETPEQVRESLDYLTATVGKDAIAYDTETTGTDYTDVVRLAQFGTTNVAVVIRIEDLPREETTRVIRDWINDALERDVRFTAQNAKFDAKHFHRLGIADGYRLMCNTDDTLTFARLLEGSRNDDSTDSKTKKLAVIAYSERAAGADFPKTPHGLKELAASWLDVSLSAVAKDEKNAVWDRNGWTDKPSKTQRDRSGWVQVPTDSLTYLRYAGADVLDTARLWSVMHRALLVTAGKEVITRERRILAWTCSRELEGFRFDVDLARNGDEDTEKIRERYDKLVELLKDKYKVTITKSRSVADAIELDLTGRVSKVDPNVENPNRPQKRNDSGKVADTHAVDVLRTFEDRSEVARLVVEAKSYVKPLTSYGNTWLKYVREGTDRIFPEIDPMGSATGRMTMRDPSLLNVPKTERRYLLADPGRVLVAGDMKAIEVRLGAGFAQDKQLITDLQNGLDPYGVVAQETYGPDYTPEQRNACKAVLLGRIYGRSVESVARQRVNDDPLNRDYDVELGEAKRIVKAIDRRWNDLHRKGFVEAAKVALGNPRVVLPTGRAVLVDPVFSKDAMNALVQGYGRELLVNAGLKLLDKGYHPNELWLSIHDEWILHVPEDRAEQALQDLEEVLTGEFMGVPIACEVGVIGKVWKKL